MASEKVRVMIIDDSALMRNLISSTLADNYSINVVGTAINGRFGLKKLNILKPDVIVLDLEMPDMDGIDFLKERKNLNIKTPVIILSSHAKKGAKITLEALSLGASDFILKPSGSVEEIKQTKAELVEMILALGVPDSFVSNEIKTRPPENEPGKLINIEKRFIPESLQILPVAESVKFEVKEYLKPVLNIPDVEILSIGISTGGPNALREILPVFPKDFPVPIVIVQHMPAGFTFEFAKSLNNICALEVKEAEEDDIIKPGRVFIAPGDKHVKLYRKKLAVVLKLDDGILVNGHRPSADVLFESTAEVYSGNAIGLIMTGMGRDGAARIGDILNKGGITIAQDQNSSVVFGMPKSAIEYKNINFVSALQDIPALIFNILNKNI